MNKIFKGLVWFGKGITEPKFSVLELMFFPFLLILVVTKPLIGILVWIGFLLIITVLSVVFEEVYKELNRGNEDEQNI